jgi:hypothetical protein
MTTIVATMKRMNADQIKPRPAHAKPKTQRYGLTDRFTADELAQLVGRYQAGEMRTALARENGIAKCTFLRLLSEHGVRARPRGLTPVKEKQVGRLRKQGMIIRDIAQHVGCSCDTARTFLLHGAGG